MEAIELLFATALSGIAIRPIRFTALLSRLMVYWVCPMHHDDRRKATTATPNVLLITTDDTGDGGAPC
jgi:hypothetical protein